MNENEDEWDLPTIVEALKDKFQNTDEILEPPTIWDVPDIKPEDIELLPWEIFAKGKVRDIGQFEPAEERGFDLPDLQPERPEETWEYGQIFETCAYYLPYSFWTNKYGIYIKESCVAKIYPKLFRMDNTVRNRCVRVASYEPALITTLGMLFLHELYHFMVEVTGIHLSFVVGDPRLYQNYFKNYYQRHFLTPKCIEEALANRYVYRRERYLKMDRNTLDIILSAQPPGYNDFKRWDLQKFHIGERKLVRKILKYGTTVGTLGFLPKGLWLENFHKHENNVKYFRGYHLPIYLIKNKPNRLFRIKGMSMI